MFTCFHGFLFCIRSSDVESNGFLLCFHSTTQALLEEIRDEREAGKLQFLLQEMDHLAICFITSINSGVGCHQSEFQQMISNNIEMTRTWYACHIHIQAAALQLEELMQEVGLSAVQLSFVV